MSGDASFQLDRSGLEAGLLRMIAVSAVVHVFVLLGFVVAPHFLGARRAPLVSYTVELVGPQHLGGTNLEPPKAKPVEKKPPAVKKVEPKPEPQKKVAPVEKIQAPKPPPAVAKPKPKVVKPKAAAKPVPKAKPNAIALAKATVVPTATVAVTPQQVAKAAPPTPKPVPEKKPEAKAKPAPQPKPEPAPKAVAKPEAPAPQRPVEVASMPRESAPPPAKPGGETAELEPVTRLRERQIAAAIERVQQRMGGSLEGTGTLPLSIGPGTGAGGEVRSIEYVRYVNEMTSRIKEGWVWAGADKGLEAVVAFSVLSTGEIANVKVTASSGNPTYDQSAERAVRAAGPLPPPPADFGDQFARVEYTFKPEDMKR